MEQWGRNDRQQVGPLYRSKWVQYSIQVSSSPFDCSDKSESILLPIITRKIGELLKKQAVERVRNPGTPSFYSQLFWLVPKKKGKLHPVIDLSSLNQYINKQHFKLETVKSVRQLIMANDWAVSIDLMDAYLHVPIHLTSRKYLRFIYEHCLSVHGLTLRNVPKPVDFHKINGSNSNACMKTCHISLPVLANKRSDSQSTNLSHKILFSNFSILLLNQKPIDLKRGRKNRGDL